MENVKNSTKVFMLHAMAFLFVLVGTRQLFAEEMSVVEVKRNITLSDDDPIYKDYYVNAGDGSALRKNLVVNVKRRVVVKDNGSKTIGDFETTVGQLKIIHVGNKVSVAREFKLTPRDEEPMIEQIGVMRGDRVDLNNSFIDYTKPVYKRKTTEAEPSITQKEAQTASAPIPSAVTPPSASTTAQTTIAPPVERLPASEKAAPTEPTLLQKIIPLPGAQGI
jgi:hypothetical protein